MNRLTQWLLAAGAAGLLMCALTPNTWADDEAKKTDEAPAASDDAAQGGDTAAPPADEHPSDHPKSDDGSGKKPKKPGKGEEKGFGKRMGKGGGKGMFEKIQAILKKLDADGDGMWTAEELKDIGAEIEKSRDENLKAELTKKCDADGDGKLNEQEQAQYDEQAAQAREKQKGVHLDGEELIAELDVNEDKAIDQEEMRGLGAFMKTKMKEAMEKEMIKKFDADGDGKLNEEEQTAAEEAKQRFMEKRGEEGEGKKPGKKRPADAVEESSEMDKGEKIEKTDSNETSSDEHPKGEHPKGEDPK